MNEMNFRLFSEVDGTPKHVSYDKHTLIMILGIPLPTL